MDEQPTREKHRVVIFLHAFSAGGAEAVLLGLANDLHERGIPVVVIAARAEGPNRRNLSPEIDVVDLQARRMAFSIPALVRALRDLKPTVCLSALTHSNIALIAAARLARSPARIVVSERLSLRFEAVASPLRKRILKQFLIARLYPKADRIIVVAKAIKDEFEAMFPAAAKKVVALANPVDVDRLVEMSEDLTAYSPGGREIPVIAFVGRLSRQKNLPLLLHAFRDLRDRLPARLVLAGDGPLKPDLEALVEDLSLGADVEFAGYLDNPYRLVREAQVLALSSDFEGLPNVLIEALALGTEVVSTDCPTGPAEILRDGQYGHLVPCGDRQAFSTALEQALLSPLQFDRAAALRPYTRETALSAYRDILLTSA